MTTIPNAGARDDVWETLKEKLGLNEAHTKAASAVAPGWDSRTLLVPCGDGHRTTHLVGLAGSYLARGFNVDQVIEHCLMWNDRNTPPLDRDKVIQTCQSIGGTDARNHPGRDHSQAFARMLANTPLEPLFNVADARIDSYLRTAPPVRRWVFEGLLPLGIVGALVSQGGAGKSQLLMQTGYSVATGLALAGHWQVGEPGTVIMLCAEDSAEEVHRRVHRIHQQIGAALPRAARKNLEDRLLIRSLVGTDMLMTQATQYHEVVRTAFVERLLLTARQAQDLKLIIIDPASRFRGGDENSNADATRFVQALEYLALQTGATVLIAHHNSKGAISSPEANQFASRGASALTDGIRWQMALTPLTKASKGYSALPTDERHHYLEAKLVKTNYTAPQPEVLLRRGAEGYLVAVTATSTVTPSSGAMASTLRIVQNSSKGITARQLEILHGGLNKSLKISERQVRAVLEDARANGYLEGQKGHPLTVTQAGIGWLQAQPAPAAPAIAARQVPRGSAARRTKIQ